MWLDFLSCPFQHTSFILNTYYFKYNIGGGCSFLIFSGVLNASCLCIGTSSPNHGKFFTSILLIMYFMPLEWDSFLNIISRYHLFRVLCVSWNPRWFLFILSLSLLSSSSSCTLSLILGILSLPQPSLLLNLPQKLFLTENLTLYFFISSISDWFSVNLFLH